MKHGLSWFSHEYPFYVAAPRHLHSHGGFHGPTLEVFQFTAGQFCKDLRPGWGGSHGDRRNPKEKSGHGKTYERT